jgi:hypothetical protein
MPAIHPALLTGDAGTSTFPGHYHPISEAIAEGWRSGAVEALERQFARYVANAPVESRTTHESVTDNLFHYR